MGGATKARVGLVGLAALAVTVAVTRYDGFNQGGGDRYKPPSAARDLVFEVNLKRHFKLGDPADPRSAVASWSVGNVAGSDAPENTKWSRNMGKVQSGTYFSLYVRPGDGNAQVATQTVTVTWGGVVQCGPVEESGSNIPRCAGYTHT